MKKKWLAGVFLGAAGVASIIYFDPFGEKQEKRETPPPQVTTPDGSVVNPTPLFVPHITYSTRDFETAGMTKEQRIEQDTVTACITAYTRIYKDQTMANVPCKIAFNTMTPREPGKLRETVQSLSGIAEISCSKAANAPASCSLNNIRFNPRNRR